VVARHTGCKKLGPARSRRRGEEGRRRGGGPARGRRRGEEGRRRGEEGSPPRRGGPSGAASRGGPPRRGRRCASGTGRADVDAAEIAGGGRRRCVRVGEERRGASRRRRGAHRGRARRGEAAVRTGASRKNDAIGGKRLSAEEGDGAYTEPPPFVMVRITNRDKRPFSLGLYYERRLKAPLLSRVTSRPVTKGAFHEGMPEGEFSPFCHGWCYHP
jgi:hypothetical protein